MSKARRRNQPHTLGQRWTNKTVTPTGESAGDATAAGLHARAGGMGGGPGALRVEQLERRELLYALSVDPGYSVVQTGYFESGRTLDNTYLSATAGNATATTRGATFSTFGYVLPFLQRQVPASLAPGAGSVFEGFDQAPDNGSGVAATIPTLLPADALFSTSRVNVRSITESFDPNDPSQIGAVLSDRNNPAGVANTTLPPDGELLLQPKYNQFTTIADPTMRPASLSNRYDIQLLSTDTASQATRQIKSALINIDFNTSRLMGAPPTQPFIAPGGTVVPRALQIITADGANDPAFYDFDLTQDTGTRVTLFRGSVPIVTFFGTTTTDDPNTTVIEQPLGGANGVRRPRPGNLFGPTAVGTTYTFQHPDGQTTFDRITIERSVPTNPTPAQLARLDVNDEIVFRDMTFSTPTGRFAQMVGGRVFGVEVGIAGSVGGAPDTQVTNPSAQALGAPVYVSSAESFTNLPSFGVGQILGTSRLRVDTNAPVATAPAVTASGIGGGSALTFTNTAGNGPTGTPVSLSLSFRDPLGNARVLRNVTFAAPAAGAGSLDVNNDIVSLFRNGVLVRQFTPANLTAGSGRTIVNNTAFAGAGFNVYVLDTTSGFDTTQAEGEGFRNFAFDEVRITRAAGTGNRALVLDRVSGFFPPTVEISDLYGRGIRETLGLPVASGKSPAPLVDPDDDGVPNFNDGIGRIVVSNAAVDTNVTIVGGRITYVDSTGTLPERFVFAFPTSTDGLDSLFETQASFGHRIETQQSTGTINAQPTISGLPDRYGSVVVGSPFIRDNRAPDAYYGYPVNANLTQAVPSSFAASRGGNPLSPLTLNTVRNRTDLQFSSTPIENQLRDSLGRPLPLVAPGSTLVTGAVSPPLNPSTSTALNPSPVLFQGVFVADGQSVGNVVLDGSLYGQSNFGGAVKSFTLGALYGSITVNGDAGLISVTGADVGSWYDTQQAGDTTNNGSGLDFSQGAGPRYATGSVILVRRTLGQFKAGGSSLASLQVLGDLNNSSLGRLNQSVYYENEVIQGNTSFTAATQTLPQLDETTRFYALLLGGFFNPNPAQGSQFIPAGGPPFFQNTFDLLTGQNIATPLGVLSTTTAPVLGTGGVARNDPILGSEFVGNDTGNITIVGRLGGFGPITTAEDQADTYAIPVTLGKRVDISLQYSGSLQEFFAARIVDVRGRTLANHQAGFITDSQLPDAQFVAAQGAGIKQSFRFSYTPDATDVVYLVLSRPPSTNNNGFLDYAAAVTGLTPVTSGVYSSASGTLPASISITGNLGLVRVAVASVSLDGQLVTPAVQKVESDNDWYTARNVQISVNGDVGAILFGGALALRGALQNTITVSGNLGALRTGLNPLAGVGPQFGDVDNAVINVGGSIGEIDINGALGARQEPFPDQSGVLGSIGPVTINTGTAGGRGDIGAILVGTYVAADGTAVRTSAGSRIDRFIVGTQATSTSAPLGSIVHSLPINLFAAGTDIRFADFRQVVTGGPGFPVDGDSILTIPFGRAQSITDDSGTQYNIFISGGTGNTASFGSLVALPVGGAGFVIGSANFTLTNGARLGFGIVSGQNAVGFGRIRLTTTGTLRSTVEFAGPGEFDVLRLEQTGTALDQLINRTVNGDIVAADVTGVRVVSVAGNIGRTETIPGARTKIGPFLGIAQGASQTVGGALGISGLVNRWDGSLYEPITDFAGTAPGDRTGLPIDPYLNGIVVRTGSVDSVAANGSIGDVILADPASTATLRQVIVNYDGVTRAGGFDGINGSIYAQEIGTIDVGDGLAGYGDSALAEAGIFANGSIQGIVGGQRVKNPIISGLIIATNQTNTVALRSRPGVAAITLVGGRVENAFIGGASLDSFWQDARSTVANSQGPGVADNPQATTTVGSILGSGTVFFRSTIFGTALGNFSLPGGVFDATSIVARGITAAGATTSRGTIASVYATTFRNSTRSGAALEYRPTQIIASDTISIINATGGDISDLEINATNNVTQIIARNIDRLNLQAGNVVSNIQATGDVRSSTLNVGRLDNLSVLGNLRSSTVRTTGALNSIYVAKDVSTTSIQAGGAAGRINSIFVGGGFDGSVSAGSTVNSVNVTGDFSGSVSTLSTVDGTLNFLRAGGDLNATLSIAKGVGTLMAGGSIGRRVAQGASTRDVIDVNGDISTVMAGGQLYADLRASGSIVGSVIIGRVSALTGSDLVGDPLISASGRIGSISVTGDFRGAILSQSGGIGSVSIVGGSLTGTTRANNAIEARDGDIGSVSISRGHLLGGISAPDGSINSISVAGDAVFGNIGVDPALSSASTAGVPAAELRPQLPVGFAGAAGVRNGPTIFAGLDINSIYVSRSLFESAIRAGRRINALTVSGNIDGGNDVNAAPTTTPSFIVAGDEINSVSVSGTRAAGTVAARGVTIEAGVSSLGADGLLGTGDDVIKSGRINSVGFFNDAVGVRVLAGLFAGANNTFDQGGVDDTVAPGLSRINSVTIVRGTVAGVSTGNQIFAKTSIAAVSAPAGSFTATIAGTAPTTFFPLAGVNTPVTGNPEFTGSTAGLPAITATGLTNASAGAANLPAGVTLRFFGAANQAFYDAANTRILLVGTALGSSLSISSTIAGTQLANLRIISTRNSILSALTVQPQLTGDASLYVDGDIGSISAGLVTLNAGSVIRAGESISSATIGVSANATPNTFSLVANSVSSINLLNGFGTSVANRIDLRSLSSLSVGGDFGGVVSVDGDVSSVYVRGNDTGNIRTGGGLNSLNVSGGATNARVSARNNIGSVFIGGATDGTTIAAGTDLGADGDFGGTGTSVLGTPNADTVTNGNISSVSVNSSFTRSDVLAGRTRGGSGFTNTDSDVIAPGASSITYVRVAGSVGSAQNSQTYGVLSNGTVGTVLVGSANVTGSFGNFSRVASNPRITPLQVASLVVDNPTVLQYQAKITFNQTINPGVNLATLLGTDITLSGTGTLAVAGNAATNRGTVTRAAGSFVADGVVAGDVVTFAGFTNVGNNDNYQVVSVTATTLTLNRAMTTEAAAVGRTVTRRNVGAALQLAQISQGQVAGELGETSLRVVGGTNLASTNDFSASYDATTRTVTLQFQPSLTQRALVPLTGTGLAAAVNATRPGPGVYKFTINSGLLNGSAGGLTGSNTSARLDGNGDGVALDNDNFSQNALVGDAGDRIAASRNGTVNLYPPTNLDLLLGSDTNGGVPQTNTTYTLRGRLGDQADLLTGAFGPASDIDVYAVSLKAGQVLRLGAQTGSAQLTSRAIYSAALVQATVSGSDVPFTPSSLLSVVPQATLVYDTEATQLVSANGQVGQTQRASVPGLGANVYLSRLPDATDTLVSTDSYLVLQTGTYYVAVGSAAQVLPVQAANSTVTQVALTGSLAVGITNPRAVAIAQQTGNTGDYSFSVRIDESGSTGFAGQATPASVRTGGVVAVQGPNVLRNADYSPGATGIPLVSDFFTAGGDSYPFITRQEASADPSLPATTWTFRLYPDANGRIGPANGIVRGTNGLGVVAVNNDPTVNGGLPTLIRTALAGGLPGGTVPRQNQFTFLTTGGVPTAGPTTVEPAPLTSANFAGAGSYTIYTSDAAGTPISNTAVAGITPALSGFTYRVTPGADRLYNTADDVIVGTNGAGVRITRNAGPDGLFTLAQGAVDDDATLVTTDAGNGTTIVTAPLPSEFFPGGVIPAPGTPLASITRGEFTFTLQPGGAGRTYQGNGTPTVRSADRIVGVNAAGVTQTVTAGADGRFGTLDDSVTIGASIGPRGQAGANTTATSDFDVYNLNDGAYIAPGTRYRVTLKTNDVGGNLSLLQPFTERLGAATALRVADVRGQLQLALFDTTLNTGSANGVNGQGVNNAALVASTNNIGGYTGRAAGGAVTNGITGYGTDANGDFYLDVLIPRAIEPTAAAVVNSRFSGTFALYVQGAVRSDYRLEVVQLPAATVPGTARTQNFLIETRGGSVNWLEATPYRSTTLDSFDPAANGVTGFVSGQSVRDYIVDSTINPNGGLVQRLRAIFNGVPGFTPNTANASGSFGAVGTIRISTNAADFAGQNYSTIYLTSSQEPTALAQSTTINNLPFGFSQRVDAFNSNPNDQAVIFARPFNIYQNTPDAVGINQFIGQLTAATARRMGELLGLRLDDQANPGDVLGSATLTTGGGLGGGFSFLSTREQLSTPNDNLRSTDFFLGTQRSNQLLSRIMLGV